MKKNIWFVTIVLFLLFPAFVLAQNIPDYVGYVNDFEKIIENTEVLEKKLQDFEKRTNHEVAVLTIPDFGDTYIEDYALKVFEKWGIGKKGIDNGVLVIVSKNERQSRIEVGYGLEGVLTDSFTGRIQDEYMIPYFKEDKYSEGINAGLEAMLLVLEGEEIPVSQQLLQEESPFPALIAIYFVLAFFSLFVPSQKVAGIGGGGVMFALGGLLFQSLLFGVLAGMAGAILAMIMSHFGSLLPKSTGTGWNSSSSSGNSSTSWGSSSSSSGGFGGFGGGSSGGGGSSRSW